MLINSIQISMFSKLGMRGSFGLSLEDMAVKDERVIALTADLGTTSGLGRFMRKYPQRYVNVGIAEQNLVGVAAGLASEGFIPFAATFANFAAMRACESIRHYLGYMKENVKVVGLSAGFAAGMFGNTHYGTQDLAIIRSIPNIVILSPADGLEVYKTVEAACLSEQPVYIRLSGGQNIPKVYKRDYEFEIGRAVILEEGSVVCILSHGSMVSEALNAAAILRQEGMKPSVINFHTLKPFDEAALIRAALDHSCIVTVEEHSLIGGLYSAVSEVLSTAQIQTRLLGLGVPDCFDKAGDYVHMVSQYGLRGPAIAARIKSFLFVNDRDKQNGI